ncbi:MAG TPA: FHA domain-containing serine/threonine-protein kinase [Ktedonobacteraceae bacterium]|nr:FHA domain-containing serine/threonine-protein kinase [Ktedonobacteraceae bacterium]
MPTLQEQQKFERYRIIRWLGNGTSGESYEAEDTILLRKVTLKLIHPWSALSDAARRQFFREMQDISLLNHPYIAQVLDYGEIDGYLYVVRRYVSSGSLLSNEGRLWYKPPLANADAIRYTTQLAQALEHIHTQGYVHGALTFANVLVLRPFNSEEDADFAPFLLADCGLANYVRHFGQPRISILPVSAAPEQSGKRLTATSDQFALATLCYFWLAGRPPYVGTPDEIQQLKLKGTFPSLASLNPHVSLEVDMVIRRALSMYPEERYPSMQAFVNAFQATRNKTLTVTPLPFSFPQLEPIAEQRTIAQVDNTARVELEPDIQLNAASFIEFERIPQTDPLAMLDIVLEQPATEPQPGPTLAPEPDILPVPQTPPSPLPTPAPEPLPVPAPEPLPTPAPEPLPTPTPETLPQIEPDIAQPLPPAAPEPPTSLPTNPTGERTLDSAQTLLPMPETPSLSTPRLIITLLETEESREVLVEQDEITLGRAGSSDILLEQDTLTSRHHALLKREGQHYLLYDQRSANGVFVNGQKLASETGYTLADGDHINIGNYEIIFRTGEKNSNFTSDGNGQNVEAAPIV